jgi:hypothetical protein
MERKKFSISFYGAVTFEWVYGNGLKKERRKREESVDVENSFRYLARHLAQATCYPELLLSSRDMLLSTTSSLAPISPSLCSYAPRISQIIKRILFYVYGRKYPQWERQTWPRGARGS